MAAAACSSDPVAIPSVLSAMAFGSSEGNKNTTIIFKQFDSAEYGVDDHFPALGVTRKYRDNLGFVFLRSDVDVRRFDQLTYSSSPTNYCEK